MLLPGWMSIKPLMRSIWPFVRGKQAGAPGGQFSLGLPELSATGSSPAIRLAMESISAAALL